MEKFRPERIKALRTRLGRTQAEFALTLGVARNTVARWEANLSQPRGLSLKALLDLYQACPEPKYLVKASYDNGRVRVKDYNSLPSARNCFDRRVKQRDLDRPWRGPQDVVLIECTLEADTIIDRDPHSTRFAPTVGRNRDKMQTIPPCGSRGRNDIREISRAHRRPDRWLRRPRFPGRAGRRRHRWPRRRLGARPPRPPRIPAAGTGAGSTAGR